MNKGTHIKNGINYSGGGTEEVVLTKAEYDALPNSKLTDGVSYFITDWNNPKLSEEYSTEEQAIGTWVDGKTLYQRTWVNTEFANASGWNTFHLQDIPTGSDYFETVVSKEIWILLVGYGKWLNVSYHEPGYMIESQIFNNGDVTYYMEGDPYNITTKSPINHITLKYTKP